MWNNIITTALLGTGKKPLLPEDLPADLLPAANIILADKQQDQETHFLQLASLVLNYRQSGVMPLHKEGVALPLCLPEERPYCNTSAVYALQDALDMDLLPLVSFWLECCNKAQQVAVPECIPTLLDIAVAQKRIRNLAVAACGNRGQWLGRMNTYWQFPLANSNEELWQTGTPEERRQVLQEIRREDAGAAREWLQQTWPQETATVKADLLKVLKINISADDAPWLESLLQEKSQKVKDEVWALLKLIPSSSIVRSYWRILQEVIPADEYSQERVSLSLPLDKAITDSGIATLSNEKNMSDEAFILYQLISYTPVSYWESHFTSLSREDIIEKFTGKFATAMVLAAIRFRETAWLKLLLEKDSHFFPDAIELLNAKEQEAYLLRFFETVPQDVIQRMTTITSQWGADITGAILKWIAKNPYQYTRNFFDKHILQLPLSIAGDLEKYAPEEPAYQATWRNTSDHIRKLLSCKMQITNAFNL